MSDPDHCLPALRVTHAARQMGLRGRQADDTRFARCLRGAYRHEEFLDLKLEVMAFL